MQRHALTSTLRLVIGNFEPPGLQKINDRGTEETAIEVAENGTTSSIGGGNNKIIALELEYLIKRDGLTLSFFLDWKERGGEARDVTIYHCDRSGQIEDAFLKETYTDCELGNVKFPAFDQAQKDKAILTVSLFPYSYSRRLGVV